MKILLIIIVLLVIFLIIKYLAKQKNSNALEENEETNYPLDSIKILKKHFGNKDFTQNKDLNELKNKLGIKSEQKNELNQIIEQAEHKVNIQYSHNINANKPYTNLNSLKTCANEVIDYSIRNDIHIKKAIVLLLLTIDNKKIKAIIDEEIEDEKLIEDFYTNLPNFIEKYNIKNIN